MRTLVLALLISFFGHLQATAEETNHLEALLPLNCAELLPESGPFIDFFQAVAQYNVTVDSQFSAELYEILEFRRIMGQPTGESENKIDLLIRKTLCFYREQREPVRPIGYDDPKFMSYLRRSLPELKKQVRAAIAETERERSERRMFEKGLRQSKDRVEQVRDRAERAAREEYQRLQRKVRSGS